jgi:hypothetical protein
VTKKPWRSATAFLDDRERDREDPRYAGRTLTHFGRKGQTLEDLVIDQGDAGLRQRRPAPKIWPT